MTITIPSWLFWVLGVPAGVIILLLAAFGVYCFWSLRNFRLNKF